MIGVYKIIGMLLAAYIGSGCLCVAQDFQTHKAAEDYLDVYQKYMSGLKNTRCSMYPSCSNYAKMVFQDYSFPVAMALTADRLIRCSHDMKFYPTTFIYGFPAAVDYPASRPTPEGVIVNYSIPQVYVGNHFVGDSSESSLDFITYLINQKNYQGAMYEIDKHLFRPTGTDETALYAYKLKCYEGLKQYRDGILVFEQSFPASVQNDYYTLFNVAHLYSLIGDANTSVSYYEKASRFYSPDQPYSHPFSELGRAYAAQKQYEKAKIAFQNKMTVDGNIVAYNSSIDIIQELEAFNGKKKSIAMALSIFPGGGYFYTNQPKNALTALILNGILGYASYTSFKSENYGVGAILSVLGLSFYIGNIVGSGNSAIKYNESIERRALDRLQVINPFIN